AETLCHQTCWGPPPPGPAIGHTLRAPRQPPCRATLAVSTTMVSSLGLPYHAPRCRESPPTLSAQRCTPARTGRPTVGLAPAPVVSGVPARAGPSIAESLYHNPVAIVQKL